MKHLSILIFIISFSQCSSLQFDKNAPFKISTAVYENWAGDQPGVKGTSVKINYTTNKDVKFENIYFRNKTTKLQTKNATSGKFIIGYFNTVSKQNELVLDKNPTKELNNPIPQIKKFPFKLKENQAVISYRINGNLAYYSIKLLQKVK